MKLAFRRYFSRPILIFLYGFWFLFIVYNFFVPDPIFSPNALLFFLLFMLFLPWALYRNTRTLFAQHFFFQDEVEFTINDKELSYKGEHFEGRLDWEVIHMVREYPNWMMLFPTRQVAYYIHRKQVDPMDWQILRSIVKGRADINSKLRKD